MDKNSSLPKGHWIHKALAKESMRAAKKGKTTPVVGSKIAKEETGLSEKTESKASELEEC